MERIRFCGNQEHENMFDISEIEVREDWISLPWGTKHQQFERVQIMQYIQLTEKLISNPIQPEVELLHLEHYSLVYSFSDIKQESFPSFDNVTENLMLEDIRNVHHMTINVLNEPTLVIQRAISDLRRQILNQLRSLNSQQLKALTKEARKQLNSQHW